MRERRDAGQGECRTGKIFTCLKLAFGTGVDSSYQASNLSPDVSSGFCLAIFFASSEVSNFASSEVSNFAKDTLVNSNLYRRIRYPRYQRLQYTRCMGDHRVPNTNSNRT